MQARRTPGARATNDLVDRLAQGPAFVLDGATGTELERRGVCTTLPLWSALALIEAPEVVEAIHRDYVEAGADALTANTFRTHARSLARGGLAARAEELTASAVALARVAAARAPAGRRVRVLGSAAPLEDCYRPDLVPGPRELEREHALHAGHLARAGVDAILVETMNTVREARTALAAALAAGRPALVSFVCGDEARLLSGETLASALDAAAPLGPLAALVNCLPPRAVEACLPVLAASGLPFGAYANLGRPNDESGFTPGDDCLPEEFAALALRWIGRGARVVGGCCGTTPAHLRALAAAVRSAPTEHGAATR